MGNDSLIYLFEAKNLGWLRGLEPPTSSSTSSRSNQLSYSHHNESAGGCYENYCFPTATTSQRDVVSFVTRLARNFDHLSVAPFKIAKQFWINTKSILPKNNFWTKYYSEGSNLDAKGSLAASFFSFIDLLASRYQNKKLPINKDVRSGSVVSPTFGIINEKIATVIP